MKRNHRKAASILILLLTILCSCVEEYWPLYFAMIIIENPYGPGLITEFSLLSKSCVDCRLQGGTNNKPDFWIDL